VSPCHPALELCSKASSMAAPCQHLRLHAHHSELSGLLQASDGGPRYRFIATMAGNECITASQCRA